MVTQLTILYSDHYGRRGKHGELQEPQGRGYSSHQRKTLGERITHTKLSRSFADQQFSHRRDVCNPDPSTKATAMSCGVRFSPK